MDFSRFSILERGCSQRALTSGQIHPQHVLNLLAKKQVLSMPSTGLATVFPEAETGENGARSRVCGDSTGRRLRGSFSRTQRHTDSIRQPPDTLDAKIPYSALLKKRGARRTHWVTSPVWAGSSETRGRHMTGGKNITAYTGQTGPTQTQTAEQETKKMATPLQQARPRSQVLARWRLGRRLVSCWKRLVSPPFSAIQGRWRTVAEKRKKGHEARVVLAHELVVDTDVGPRLGVLSRTRDVHSQRRLLHGGRRVIARGDGRIVRGEIGHVHARLGVARALALADEASLEALEEGGHLGAEGVVAGDRAREALQLRNHAGLELVVGAAVCVHAGKGARVGGAARRCVGTNGAGEEGKVDPEVGVLGRNSLERIGYIDAKVLAIGSPAHAVPVNGHKLPATKKKKTT
jgi:hypothetical protein